MIDCRDPDIIRTMSKFFATSVLACREIAVPTLGPWTEKHLLVSVSVALPMIDDQDDDDCCCQSENEYMLAMNSVLNKSADGPLQLLLQYDRKAVTTRQETRPSTTSRKENDEDKTEVLKPKGFSSTFANLFSLASLCCRPGKIVVVVDIVVVLSAELEAELWQMLPLLTSREVVERSNGRPEYPCFCR